MQKNAYNDEINLVKKIVVVKLFNCSCKVRIKQIIIRRTIKIVTIVKKKTHCKELF